MMQPLGQTLRRLREEQGMMQTEVAAWLTARYKPVKSKAVSSWERGDAMPNAMQLIWLCELYGVADVGEVFQNRPGLNAEGQEKLRDFARLLAMVPQYRAAPPAVPGRSIRFYTLPVSAGHGQFLDGDGYELNEVDASVPPEADYAVWISGDSMEPRFVNKQWVYVKEQPTLDEGDIGIFLYDGESYCKVLGRAGGRPALLSLNGRYAPIAIDMPGELRVLGKVVG